MKPPKQLENLASKFSLTLKQNDRVFFRKYKYKLEFSHHINDPDAVNYNIKLREMAYDAGDKIRRERFIYNYYSDDPDNIIKFSDYLHGEQCFYMHKIGWFPDFENDITIHLRYTPVEYPMDIKLGNGVNKQRLKDFYENNKEYMYLLPSTLYVLYPDFERNRIAASRPTTWGYTNFRFNNEDCANMFKFTFAEYISSISKLVYVGDLNEHESV